MSIYTIGDLHLSFHENKPMSIFGEKWENHEEKIRQNWIENVTKQDLVILPGDFSWSMKLQDTVEDFEYINELPGKKILLKGNHDYWWTTVTSMKKFLQENKFENIEFLHNNSYEFENYIIVGTRGWIFSNEEEDKKILEREAFRLELSIQSAIENTNNKEIIVFMHYPPVIKQNVEEKTSNIFIDIMKKYGIKRCFYGHLHAMAINEAIEGEFMGIDFKLVSCDGLQFRLFKIN